MLRGNWKERLFGNTGEDHPGARSSRRVNCLCALCVFLVSFALLLTCLGDGFFDSDEGEIFSKAISITHGQRLYLDVCSQHTPVMYYFAALFNLLGASTVYEFRIGFYLLFSALWALNTLWYSDKLNRLGTMLFPILYILTIKYIGYGTCILSEHAQATGMAILFFELMCFGKDRKLDLFICMRISLAIFLAVGSAFTSVFPIFFLALTVFALEIKYYIKAKSEERAIWRKAFPRKYLRLALVVAAPFCALCLYYVCTKTMGAFYYWAYKFNVTIYSNYQGTGGSVIQSMFDGFRYMLNPLKNISGDIGSKIQVFITVGGFLSFVLIGIHYRSVILPIGLLLMLNGCETRGDTMFFHSMHAVMLECVAISYASGLIASKIRLPYRNIAVTAAYLMLLLLLAKRYHGVYPTLPALSSEGGPDSMAYVVDLLTDEGERVGNATVMESIYVQSETVPASIVSASVKWVWDGAGDRAMEQLRADPPRVYVLDKDYAIWGYPVQDYAAELVEFVEQNYTPLDKYLQGFVYVRNDYYEEACDIMDSLYGQMSILGDRQVNMAIDRKEIVGNKLCLVGWAFVDGVDSSHQRTYILLQHAGRPIGLYKTLKVDRPDMSRGFGALYGQCGFYAIIEVDESLTADDIEVIPVVDSEEGIFASSQVESLTEPLLLAAG